MRILHIIDTLDPAAGGPSESIRRIVASYPAMEHSGEVVTLDEPDAPFLRELNFTVHALGPRGSTYGANPRLIPWLKENRTRFDGAVSHGLWTFNGYATWKAFAGKLPYAVFPHGMLDPYFKRAFPMKHMKKWVYWLTAQYWILRAAHRVLFTSTAEAELAKQSFWLHQWNPQVVPYGASGPEGDPAAYKKAFFAHCPTVAGKPYLLFLGRIHPKKGCDLLVDAFAQIAKQTPDLQLVFAGPDQVHWRVELEAKAAAAGIADRLHWPGMIRGDLKWGAYYGCEAFVLPSHQENFGISVAEALACGKPVLLADKVNIAQDVQAAGAAFVEPDSAAGTLRLLEVWLRTTPAERDQMAANALACFHARYDMRENAKAIIRIFEDVTREAAR
ncbi:MAG TPA: glycosyltransferase [Acidobacteriaceae bacterium]|nr:glycosyltransferase [Acidobacteriaceae bacterium]